MNTSFDAAMSAAGIESPAMTATPSSSSVPAAGGETIVTAASVSGGLSCGSLKPKSLVVNAYDPSLTTDTVLSTPSGASLTEVTSIVMVLGLGSRSAAPVTSVPPSSRTWKVIVS